MRRFFITYYTYYEPETALDIRAYTLKGAKRKAKKHLKTINARIYTIEIQDSKGGKVYI